MERVDFTLTFTGRDSDNHEIDFYDVAQALIGFERSLALTTHLILNNEIITQAPALNGARILARPSREGSWELTATIILLAAGAAYKLGTAPKDTPIGHVIHSAYDYVISQTLGFHIDYTKTLGQQLTEKQKVVDGNLAIPDQNRLDSLTEKCETAIREMHRPIAKSATATEATITTRFDAEQFQLSHALTLETYEHIAYTDEGTTPFEFQGRISSYNINTFKGRVYVPEMGRPLPFELAESSRNIETVSLITNSLSANALDRDEGHGDIKFTAFEFRSRAGRLKSLLVLTIV